MELRVIEDAEKKIVVLLNDEMRIVKPVYNYPALKGKNISH